MCSLKMSKASGVSSVSGSLQWNLRDTWWLLLLRNFFRTGLPCARLPTIFFVVNWGLVGLYPLYHTFGHQDIDFSTCRVPKTLFQDRYPWDLMVFWEKLCHRGVSSVIWVCWPNQTREHWYPSTFSFWTHRHRTRSYTSSFVGELLFFFWLHRGNMP